MNLLAVLLILLFVASATVFTTATMLWLGSLLLPGVQVNGFGNAIRAGVSFIFWRALLSVPAVVLIALGTSASVWSSCSQA